MRIVHPSRGFTLVELMVVVGIIGILSSVAIPEFSRISLRARTSERREMMVAISKCMSDLVLNKGGIPGGALTGNWNPAGAPTTTPRVMNLAVAGWDQLALRVEGGTYYSYKFTANDVGNPPTPTLDVWASGDLDGDGTQSSKQISYVGFGHVFAIRTEVPDEGHEDEDTF